MTDYNKIHRTPHLPLPTLMPDFIETIPIAGKKYYFTFRKVFTPDGVKFFVSTLENNDLISFEIKGGKFGDWKLLDPVPDWIRQIERKLFEAIKNHLDKK
jgi:hypothetical protein